MSSVQTLDPAALSLEVAQYIWSRQSHCNQIESMVTLHGHCGCLDMSYCLVKNDLIVVNYNQCRQNMEEKIIPFKNRSLTHCRGRMTHICVSKLTIIVSDERMSPGRHQAIIWTNPGILFMRILGTNFNEINHASSFKKMYLKMPSAKWWHFCLGLNDMPRGFVK